MEYYNQMSNSWYFNPIICTNPCGEQGLPGWGVCNLSAMNLSKFYDEANHDVAWDELATTTRYSVRFLDNVIDRTPYHFEENIEPEKERRVGLGTMGLAELMIKLNIRYGSPESLEFLDKLYGFIAREAYLASADIAEEKGSFQAFDAELYLQSGFMKNMAEVYPEVAEAVREKAHGTLPSPKRQRRRVRWSEHRQASSRILPSNTSVRADSVSTSSSCRLPRIGWTAIRAKASGLLRHGDESLRRGSHPGAGGNSALGGQLDLEDGQLSVGLYG